MLRIEVIKSSSSILPKVQALYERAFPENERIPMKILLEPMEGREFLAFYDDELDDAPVETSFVGFVNSITRCGICNIIYFAVEDSLRGRGYGSQILQHVRNTHPNEKIVVDVEDENAVNDAEAVAERILRQDFYIRNGFGATPVDYKWQGESYKLMVSGGHITEKEFLDFWKEVLKGKGVKYP